MRCAKMVELVKMQFGRLNWVGPGNMYYGTWGVDAPMGRDIVWGAWPTESIVKHRILRVG